MSEDLIKVDATWQFDFRTRPEYNVERQFIRDLGWGINNVRSFAHLSWLFEQVAIEVPRLQAKRKAMSAIARLLDANTATFIGKDKTTISVSKTCHTGCHHDVWVDMQFYPLISSADVAALFTQHGIPVPEHFRGTS